MFGLLMASFTEEQYPLKIYHDFEKATLNAVEKWLPSTKIEGCYFHFAQNLWRQMQLKRLSKLYIENKETRFHFNQLKCLSFVPPNKVIECFKIVKGDSSEELSCMLINFENFYIGKCRFNVQ